MDAGDVECALLGVGGALNSLLKIPSRNLGFIGDSLHLALVYNAADVFVATSKMENLANTVLEAMACGTPCVAFGIGGMPDVIAHLENGYIAEAFSAEELAEGVAWVLDHSEPGLLASSARQHIVTSFSLEQQATQFHELYKRVVEA
jgi:glycosyltransferase involved in cell wall biosynthesis